MTRINGNIASVVSLLLAGLLSSCGGDRVAIPSESAESASEKITYDPSACKTDAQGMVYFALGREVFRKPYEESMFIFPLPPQDLATIPPRPDPSEMPGCPGNPLSGLSFSLLYQHQPANPQQYLSNISFRAERLEIIGRAERLKGTDLEFGLQPLLEGDYERVKNQDNRCELLANGLNECRVVETERSSRYWTSMFQADPSYYSVPYNRLFTVSCSSSGVIDRQDCRVSYNYSEDTRIDYKFDVYEMPRLEIIEFDKGVRALIESMRVQNYRWADKE